MDLVMPVSCLKWPFWLLITPRIMQTPQDGTGSLSHNMASHSPMPPSIWYFWSTWQGRPFPPLRLCSGSSSCLWASLCPAPDIPYFQNHFQYNGFLDSLVLCVDLCLQCHHVAPKPSTQWAPLHPSHQYPRCWVRAWNMGSTPANNIEIKDVSEWMSSSSFIRSWWILMNFKLNWAWHLNIFISRGQ